ncbi:BspA family leucine-rich repeat surface protein [Lactococcus garvieae]|uniref:BspA family leucine-rich repeat surface protein n=1 Tax=Lactococcus garvieae TaxID=1363 RepID=UPI00254D2D85|nr:BspA family leucine-rich repeat surface protein [Lactococcus garvieae]
MIVTFLVVYYICPVTVSGVDTTRVENQRINVSKERLKTEKIDSSIDNSEPKFEDGVTDEKDSGESEVESEETALENSIEVPILKNTKALPLDNLKFRGKLGTGEWGIYENGTLYFTEGTFKNAVSSPVPSALPDWSRYTRDITRIELGGKLICTNSLSKMFSGLKNVKTIENLPLLDTSQATDMSSMFSDMYSLSSLDISNFDTSQVTNMSSMFSSMSSLSSLDVSKFDTSQVTDMSSMFSDMSALSSLDVSNFDTSRVTNMSSMFSSMYSLSSLDLSKFDTSRVTSMSSMFSRLRLKNLNISNFKTSQVTSMSSMFSGMSSLLSLDISNFDTSRVTSMSSMFSGMSSLSSLDISNFDTSQVTNMFQMFSSMPSLSSLDLSNFDTSRVTNMSRIFEKTSSLSSLNISNFDTSRVTNMSYMFSGVSSLSSLNISNFDTSKVTNMYQMFYNMSSLSSLDISNFDTSQVTDMSSMFSSMSSLSSLDISTFDMSKVASGRTSSMFSTMSNISQLTLGSKNKFSTTNSEKLPAISPSDQYTGKWINNTTGKNIWTSDELMKNYRGNTDEGEYVWQSINKWGEVPWEFDEDSGKLTFTGTGVLGETLTSPWCRTDIMKIDGEKIKKIIFQEKVSAPINSSYLFSDAKAVNLLSSVQSIIGLEKMDTSQVNTMYSMFYGMSSLTTLDVTNFNTNNVENMTYMFQGLRNLKNLDVTNFDTRKVIGMGNMFDGLKELENLDVANFNTSNVTNMGRMFQGLSKLKKLDVSNFDTRKVKNSDYMFAGLKNIVDLDVSKFESSSSVKNMFDGMDKVTKLDVSGFRINGDVDHMFRGTNNMKELVLGSNFDTYYLRKTDIPEISKEKPYTGNWINADTKEIVGSSSKFMNMRPRPGTYKWEIGDFLELNLVPNSIDFETTLESDEYLATQNFENSSIMIYNSLLERNWAVKATIQKDELITYIDETKNSYPVTSFLMNDVELVGTGATGIVMQAQQDKTSENNTGEISKKVDIAKINFLDTKSSLKAGNKLVGQINYQLYNTPSAN